MKNISFEEALALIQQRDARYHPDAYEFLREALDFTLHLYEKPSKGPGRHVSGRELLDGFRQLALKEFGPMAWRVLTHWGLRRTEDVGELVFNLVEVGVLGKTERDRREDFARGYDFEAAFIAPYRPPTPRRRTRRTAARRLAAPDPN